MMFCPKCGTVLPDRARFCSACGSSIEEQQLETKSDDLVFFGIDHPFYVPRRRRLVPFVVGGIVAVAIIVAVVALMML